MAKSIAYVGMDVHAETIAVAVADEGRAGEVRSLGRIANRPEAVRKLIKTLGEPGRLRVCYEAGPCGYILYWQLAALGVRCEVIAPTLVPVKAGDRVKTDRRDAIKLARCHRAGELTPIWVPDHQHEALRDLVRAREAAKQDQVRARNRLGKFLLRHGHHRPAKMPAWGSKHLQWLRSIALDNDVLQQVMIDHLHEVDHAIARIARLDQAIEQAVCTLPEHSQAVIQGLQALRGVRLLTATTVVAEVGELSRFDSPSQLMAYAGVVSREYSSGGPSKERRGAITKAGNNHLRRIVGEAACAYRHRPATGQALKRRQQHLSEEVRAIAWKAQHRLNQRYRHLDARGKERGKVFVALGRELLGFMWAIGKQVESEHNRRAGGSSPPARVYRLAKTRAA